MKCATVRGEHEICMWLDHDRQSANLAEFPLGESWWASKRSSVKMSPTLVSKSRKIREASVLLNGRKATLLPPFKKENSKQILVHLKVTPILDGGVRYSLRLKKGRKLAERQMYIRNGEGKLTLNEMLITMGPGDEVQATRTGKLLGEAEHLTISCSQDGEAVTVTR
jgi:hypothetical protein